MIALQNLLPMLVDADDAFILALEAHLRALNTANAAIDAAGKKDEGNGQG